MKNSAIILTVIILTSCQKDEIIKNDYLIFGHFYGECAGESCVETYKLTNDKLYEDLNDNYYATSFNFVELSNDKFNDVNDLSDFLPDLLLDENDSTFGCPDCHDQGGLFVSYNKDDELKSWRIDQSKDDVPNYLHDFIDKINEKIALINN